jgi:hypothetical protein
MSKPQVTINDDSTLMISPESRVGIEAYMFDASKNKRNAVVQLFQGLAHVAVSKIFKAAEPDFVVKTQTAIMGVRGTDFGVRIYPNSSDVLNFEGHLQVGNLLPGVSQLFRRAFKVAYSFGSGGAPGQQWVFLKAMQGTTVGRGLPPSAIFDVTPAMKNSFMQQFSTLGSRGPGGSGTGGGGVTAGVGGSGGNFGIPGAGGTDPGSGFLGLNKPGAGAIIPLDSTITGTPTGVVTPPVVVPSLTPKVTAPTTTTTTTTTLPPHPPR